MSRVDPGPGPWYQPVTAASGVASAALRTPGKVALVDGERSLTFGALAERVDRLAAALLDGLGLRPGDRVGVLGVNGLEYVEAVLALARAGLVSVHLGARAAPAEISFACTDAEVRAVLVHTSLRSLLDGADLPRVTDVVELESAAYEQLVASGDATRALLPVPEWETFSVFYTSGTTGRPKGVAVSHRSRVLNFYGMAAEYGCFGPDDHALAIAPLSHGAGLSFALAPLFFGGTTTLHRSFEPGAVVDELAAGPITNVFVVPTHLQRILDLGPERLGPPPRGLRRIVSNAAALPYPLKERVVTHFGPEVLFECYGSTEAGIVCNLAPQDQLRKPGSVGRAFPATHVRILDADGRDVPDGEIGELHSTSAALFNGYLHVDPDKTPGMRDGWFSAGDLARRDAEGYLYIVGRRDDMIVTGGLNVHPREVEDVLMTHPAVDEAAVVGLPDERWGHAVHAVVTLRAGASVTLAELVEHAGPRLARYKLPKAVTVLPDLPRNANGKIVRRELPPLLAARSSGDTRG